MIRNIKCVIQRKGLKERQNKRKIRKTFWERWESINAEAELREKLSSVMLER